MDDHNQEQSSTDGTMDAEDSNVFLYLYKYLSTEEQSLEGS